jgi:hypothetical protein
MLEAKLMKQYPLSLVIPNTPNLEEKASVINHHSSHHEHHLSSIMPSTLSLAERLKIQIKIRKIGYAMSQKGRAW